MYGPQSIHGITIGGDVIAWKMALDRAGYFEHKYYLDYDNRFNRSTVQGTKEFQKHNAIDPSSGNVGRRTFEVMLKTRKSGSTTEWAFSPTAKRIYDEAREEGQKPTESDVANFIVSSLWDMYEARAAIDYTQARPTYPIVHRILEAAKSRRLDCSGTCNYSQWLAMMHFRTRIVVPAIDPIYQYSGYGNTWSIAKGGMRVQEQNAKIGDMAWYHNHGHMARIVNLDPISVVSMGSDPGPLYLPLHYSDVNEIRTYPLIRS